MIQTLLFSVLVVLLAGSTWFFYTLYSSSRKRELMAIRRFEENRRILQDGVLQTGALVESLVSIHDLEFLHSFVAARSSLAEIVVNAACKLMKCPAGSLMLVARETRELAVVYSNGIPSDKPMRDTHFKSGEGIAGRVMESGKMIVVGDVDTDPRFLKRKDFEYRFKTMVAVPVKVKNRVIGVLNVHAPEPFHAFNDREIQLLNLLAEQSAITLETWELYDDLHQFYIEMIKTLSRVMEMKEKISRSDESMDNSRILARKIAEELNLPEAIVRHVEYATLVYQIGKITIDDAVLRKPGKLTEEEYEQVKRHPIVGKDLVSRVRFLAPVATMILYHQERWDGKGYPAGLKGEEIPLGSRIVAVINSHQAMVSDRPYRKALPVEEAMHEILRGSGTQFDPKVVEAFVTVLKKEKADEAIRFASGNSEPYSGTRA